MQLNLFNYKQIKKCIVCNQIKKITEFQSYYSSLRKKYYIRNQCIKCRSIYHFQRYHKDIKKSRKKSRDNYFQNKESRALYAKKYYKENKEKIKLYAKKYVEKNKEIIIEKKRIYNQKEEVKQRRRFLENKRKKEDFNFKLKKNIRRIIRESITRCKYSKNCKTFDIIGISHHKFLKYIESKFYNNMNWHNKGKWHIDHIIPLKAAKTEFEVIALNHYTNLQPLWAKDNLTKRDSFNKEDFDNYMNWYIKNVRTEEEYNSLTL